MSWAKYSEDNQKLHEDYRYYQIGSTMKPKRRQTNYYDGYFVEYYNSGHGQKEKRVEISKQSKYVCMRCGKKFIQTLDESRKNYKQKCYTCRNGRSY